MYEDGAPGRLRGSGEGKGRPSTRGRRARPRLAPEGAPSTACKRGLLAAPPISRADAPPSATSVVSAVSVA